MTREEASEGLYGWFGEAVREGREPKTRADRVVECILEGLHGSLDGWTDKEVEVIEDFLTDVRVYVEGVMRDERGT